MMAKQAEMMPRLGSTPGLSGISIPSQGRRGELDSGRQLQARGI